MKNQHYLQLGLGVVAAFIIFRVVGVTLGGLSLLVLVIACPVLMFFMMRNMGGMNHRDRADHETKHQH